MSAKSRGAVSEARKAGKPAAIVRKPVAKQYGARGEYAMTAYERRRLERKGSLPPRTIHPGVVPGAADCDATPEQDAPASPSGRRVQPF